MFAETTYAAFSYARVMACYSSVPFVEADRTNALEFIRAARTQENRRAMVLIENHNLAATMTAALRRGLPEVLALPADLFCYYYYPRNVAEPERVMRIIGRALKRLRASRP